MALGAFVSVKDFLGSEVVSVERSAVGRHEAVMAVAGGPDRRRFSVMQRQRVAVGASREGFHQHRVVVASYKNNTRQGNQC